MPRVYEVGGAYNTTTTDGMARAAVLNPPAEENMKSPTVRPTVLVAIMFIGLLAAAMLACETQTAAPGTTESPPPGGTATAAPGGTESPAPSGTETDTPSDREATQAPETAGQPPTLTSTATPTVVPAATPPPAPTAAPTPSPTAVPVPTPTPTAVPTPATEPTPAAEPTPPLVPTITPTGASGTGFPWEQDGLTDLEQKALVSFQRIEDGNPAVAQVLRGFPWLADSITEDEELALVYLEIIARATRSATNIPGILAETPWLTDGIAGEDRLFLQEVSAIRESSTIEAILLAMRPGDLTPSTPTPVPATEPPPTTTPTPAPQPTSTPVLQPALDITPLRGSPGDVVSVSGTNFPGLTAVSGIEIGGVSVIPATPYSTTTEGAFSASVVVPRLDVGTYHFVVTVGGRSSTAAFSVVESPTTTGEPVAAALAPLGSNLLWVAYYDNATKQWSVYDPSGAFSPDLLILPPGQAVPSPSEIGALTHVVPRKIYWMNISRDQTVTLGGAVRTLTAGANSVSW